LRSSIKQNKFENPDSDFPKNPKPDRIGRTLDFSFNGLNVSLKILPKDKKKLFLAKDFFKKSYLIFGACKMIGFRRESGTIISFK